MAPIPSVSPTPLAGDRRRALLREAREAPPPVGVFVIHCLPTGRIHVGGSLNAPAVLQRTQFELRLRQHRRPQLQADWNQHGPEAFRFEVIDRVKGRDEPGFDWQVELDALVALWRQELVTGDLQAYGEIAR